MASLTTPTPLGFTAGDVLAAAQGEHALTLTWHPRRGDSVFLDFGRTGATQASLTMSHEGGALRHVAAERQEPRGPTNDLALSCPSRLEVEARMHLRSDDGAFDTVLPVVLVREESDGEHPLPAFTQPFDPETDGGDLVLLDIQPPDPDDFGLELAFEFGDEPRGELRAWATYRSGSGAAIGNAALASFDLLGAPARE